jgi:hypothetical protein
VHVPCQWRDAAVATLARIASVKLADDLCAAACRACFLVRCNALQERATQRKAAGMFKVFRDRPPDDSVRRDLVRSLERIRKLNDGAAWAPRIYELDPPPPINVVLQGADEPVGAVVVESRPASTDLRDRPDE